ncbi:MAG: response regulator transcription factor [Candidatus Didemnitutus sp.]|nr:response regulator transcription factor [Candidatus Didemnitutus sp.]
MPPAPPSRVRVALIEDDVPFRSFVAGLLNESSRYETVAQADSAEAAATWSAQLRPDLALVDIALPGASGTIAVRQLLEKFPALTIVMLTARTDDDSILDAIKAGAVGYIVKGTHSAELVAALDDAGAGGAPMSPAIARRVLALMRDTPSPAAQMSAQRAGGSPLQPLTPREHDVLSLVATGASDKEAAARLGISVSAVKQHLANIYAKWRVRSRTEAAIKFTQAGR